MSIRKYFSSFDNSGITYSMNEKLEVENTIYEYLNDTLFKKRHAMDILNNIDVYPYKDDIISLLYILSKNIKPEKLYDASTLDKLIRMQLDNKKYAYIFNKLNRKQRKNFIQLCLINKSNIRYDLLILTKEEKNIIRSEVQDVLSYYKHLFYLKELFKDDKETLSKIGQYINKNGDRIIDEMISPLYNEDEDKIEGHKYIKMIVDDILKNEKANYNNVNKLKSGGFSCVYSIKDKVIKLGSNGRVTASFPNNPYIIKPILRKVFELDGKEIFVEVTQKVDSNESNITKEDLYKLYTKLRNLKIRWTDVHTRNVGKLIKDNKIYWHNDLRPTDESLGLQKYRGTEELKAGELVVLDADFMYDENDKKIKMASKSFDREFEIRYQRERRLKKHS